MSDAVSNSVPTQNSKLKTPKLIEVSAGLVFRNGLLLITKRDTHVHLGGLWEFPGGKREIGESDEECLRRELHEELGIEVEVRELVQTLRHDYPEKSIQLKFFRCVWRQNEPKPIGCADIAWVDATVLGEYSFPEADSQLIQLLRRDLEFWKVQAE